MTPAFDAWRDAGRYVRVGDDDVFVRDEPAADTSSGLPPILVCHGYPTCSYDWAPVLADLAARRRVLIPDYPGYGLSSKPDRRYGIHYAADAVQGVLEDAGVTEIDLVSHDLGDTVAGELLARQLEGDLAVGIRRRVVTNGSIYIGMAQLSAGQLLLLGLPDEAVDFITEEAFTNGLIGTFAPDHTVDADELATLWQMTAHEGGQRLLARTIRYIEDRRAEEARFTGAIETHPSPLGVVWGELDPIAVHAMTDRLLEARPGTPRTTLHGIGHYPMLEAPAQCATAILEHLDT